MFERVIADQARTRPDAVAFVGDSLVVTFKQMAGDIDRCADWLGLRGYAAGERVVLHVPSIYRHWVLFFALEAVGAISIAASPLRPLTASELAFLKADRFITQTPPDPAWSAKGDLLDASWLAGLRQVPLEPQPARSRSSEDPICIVLSSGTTGQPKKVLLTRLLIDLRAVTEKSSDLIHTDARIHQALPNTSIGGLTTVLSAWSVGATVGVQSAGESLPDLWARLKPTVIVGAPSHFARMLDELPEAFIADPPIHASAGGGAMPLNLAERITRTLRGRIAMTYASTEMGYVARADHHQLQAAEGAVGMVLPYAKVQIRDENGDLAAEGVTGQVWVSGRHVAAGFHDSPEQTASSFQDGWFHPGDVGMLRADGLLVITARSDDLMNFQGIKMAAPAIEDRIRALGVVKEVAVFMAPRGKRRDPILWVVYEADRVVASRELIPGTPRGVPFAAVWIDAIPRNAMGKVERAALRARAEAGALGLQPRMPT